MLYVPRDKVLQNSENFQSSRYHLLAIDMHGKKQRALLTMKNFFEFHSNASAAQKGSSILTSTLLRFMPLITGARLDWKAP
jgi:hypothetical protein